MNKYNDKYKTKIDCNNILQSTEDLLEIIEKLVNIVYILFLIILVWLMKMLSKMIHSIIILL